MQIEGREQEQTKSPFSFIFRTFFPPPKLFLFPPYTPERVIWYLRKSLSLKCARNEFLIKHLTLFYVQNF